MIDMILPRCFVSTLLQFSSPDVTDFFLGLDLVGLVPVVLTFAIKIIISSFMVDSVKIIELTFNFMFFVVSSGWTFELDNLSWFFFIFDLLLILVFLFRVERFYNSKLSWFDRVWWRWFLFRICFDNWLSLLTWILGKQNMWLLWHYTTFKNLCR